MAAVFFNFCLEPCPYRMIILLPVLVIIGFLQPIVPLFPDTEPARVSFMITFGSGKGIFTGIGTRSNNIMKNMDHLSFCRLDQACIHIPMLEISPVIKLIGWIHGFRVFCHGSLWGTHGNHRFHPVPPVYI